MTNYIESLAILANRNADHLRIRTMMLTDFEGAVDALANRMLDDMHDAIHDTPERDDDAAIAARRLNATPGMRLLLELRAAARAALNDL